MKRLLQFTFPSIFAFAASAISCFVTANLARAEVNGHAIEPTGLVVHWEANLGGSGLPQAEHSMVIWPHSTIRKEHVDVYLGSKLIERINGAEIDQQAVSRLILEGKSPVPAPTLGLEGAKAKAEKLAKKYEVLGRKLTIEPFSEPMTYVVTMTTSGIVATFDAETGESLWRAQVPRSDFPMLGPGVSDNFVTVANGSNLYVYELLTGNLVLTQKLKLTPTGAPLPVQENAMVPSEGGRLVAYDIRKKAQPVILRGGRENRLSATVSADRQFVAWTSQENMYIVKNDKKPEMWSQVRAHDNLESRPIATDDGFIFVSSNGTVFRATTARIGSLVWRTSLAAQMARTPVVGHGVVLALSDDGRLFALNLETGEMLWRRAAPNIADVLGIGKEHVYVRQTSKTLSVLDLKTGEVLNHTNVVIPTVVPNSINDRYFVVTRDGQLSCLRERDAVKPTMFASADRAAQKAPAKEADAPQAAPTKKPATSEDDPFGDTDSSMDSEDSSSSDDPFANP